MHLRYVFERIRKSKLYCKLKKCIFGKEYTKYLGHKIVHRSIEVDPSKTVAVSFWPDPMWVKGLVIYWFSYLLK